jgi:hypothetical protein
MAEMVTIPAKNKEKWYKLQLFHEEDDSKKLEQQKLGQLEMGVNPSPN